MGVHWLASSQRLSTFARAGVSCTELCVLFSQVLTMAVRILAKELVLTYFSEFSLFTIMTNIFCWRNSLLSSFTHLCLSLNSYDFISSVEHKRTCLKNVSVQWKSKRTHGQKLNPWSLESFTLVTFRYACCSLKLWSPMTLDRNDILYTCPTEERKS